MLEDRDYMRQTTGGVNRSATVMLVIILIVAFILQLAVLNPEFTNEYLALSLSGIQQGFFWQLFTFQFMHGGWLHLLLNGWALYMFGREVEWVLGKFRFLTLYFSSGIIGGLFQLFVSWVWPDYFFGPMVGASAGIFGIVAAFAMLYPDRVLTLLLFFVIPINMRARTLLIISLVIAALGIASVHFPTLQSALGGNVAHAAHLGGILTGLAFIRWSGKLELHLRNPNRRRKRSFAKTISFKMVPWARSKNENTSDIPSEEFISREVDPILDKISEHGIQSLTERERQILEAARSKMAKR